MAILPGELTDRIIDHLHDDADALKMCSLTCKTWLPSSRHHLFSTVRIDANLTSFLSIVDVSWSTLGPAIQRLVLHKIERLPFPIMPSDLLPSRLPNVRTLELSNNSIAVPSFKNAIPYLDLEELVIHDTSLLGCYELVRIICAYPKLERLTLFNLIWLRRWTPGPHLETPKQRLSFIVHRFELLDDVQCHLFGQWLLDHCQPLQINHLVVHLGEDQLVCQFIRSSGPSIKTMTLSLTDAMQSDVQEGHLSDIIDLTPCINLRSLTIWAYKAEPGASWSAISSIQAIISSVSSSHFETLDFSLTLSGDSFPNCTNIAKLLTRSPSPFTNLKKIGFVISVPTANSHNSLVESVRNEFSVFNARGILEVQVFGRQRTRLSFHPDSEDSD